MLVKKIFKSCLIEVLALKRQFPTPITKAADLSALIRELHPLTTTKPLIRFGPSGDGGYLLPDDLAGVSACFSPGVSFVSGFEKDCADLGIPVFLADKSVDGPAADHSLFHFTKKFIGATSNDDFLTLDDWVSASGVEKSSELILQIDIEGYEYEVFMSASDALMKRFRLIVAEFHFLDQLWSRPFFIMAERAFRKILQTHSCVHIHPNNVFGTTKHYDIEIPQIMEFTFLRRDRIEDASFQRTFPNQLDSDNTSNPTIILPKCWYRQK